MADLPVALRNAWALSFGDGIEQRVPTPSTTIYDEPHRHLSRYDRSTPATGNPVLLVPPLAVTISCYDLRPGQSLAEYLLDIGKQAYVIDYGEIGYEDRNLGFEEWTHDIIPAAVRRVSAEHGGAPVDLIGWSFGGTISILTAAAHADLPIASVTAIGTPFDQRKNPGVALPRAIARYTGGREVTEPTKWFGGIPKQAVRAGFRVQAFSREITRPVFIARNLANTEALARMESIDRFIGEMPGYPGRLYRQSYRQFIQRNELAKGTVNLRRNCVIELSKLTCRVLLIGSRSDILAPAAAVAAGVDVLTGAVEARYEEVGGSHLGMVAGPEARTATWPLIEDFLEA
ncbi:alpha/beta fold hydrolase [Antrihabitans sp. YC2-6]|nr:alpha/beta fold hydrolase [Antrihabitans sp. YC2-6]